MRNRRNSGNGLGIRVVVGLIVSLLTVATIPVAAQTTTNASIIGQLTDESGAVLPGVTVTASSPALQVREVSTASDAQGEYRLTTLPLGTYDVSYALDGFQGVKREGLRLTAGFTAKVDVTLKVGSLTETVTVSGASPVVDVASTTPKTQVTREVLDLIPSSRNGFQAVLAQVPGGRSNLDVGGNSGQTVWQAFGQRGEAWPTLEGVLMSSPKQGAQSVYPDFATLEDVQVSSMGNDAEMPTRGIQLTAVMKSGGNTFHGTASTAYSNSNFNGDNVDDALAAQGIRQGNPLVLSYDVYGDLGGRIVRDALWFYGSGRARDYQNTVIGVFRPDGSQAVSGRRELFYTGKVSYQASRSNRLIGFYQDSVRIMNTLNQFFDWDTRNLNELFHKTYKGEWQGTFGNTVVASAQYGSWGWHNYKTPYAPGKISTYDLVTLRYTGANIDTLYDQGERRHHVRGSVSWYRPELFLGDHEFKSGFDYMPQRLHRDIPSRQAVGDYYDYHLLFRSGVPFQIITYNTPVSPRVRADYAGMYVKDNWTLNRRLTLNLGVRITHDSTYLPAQSREAGPFAAAQSFPRIQFKIWNALAPRLRFAYDIAGNGKTLVKGGWGRFVHVRGIDEAEAANQNARTWTTWTWRDTNGNRLYEPGEINLDPNGPDFISTVASYTAPSSGSAPLSGRIPSPDERAPKVDEFTLSIERELMPNFALRVSGVHSREFDLRRLLTVPRPYSAYSIPITNRDPGPDGRVGSDDDPGTTVTYYEYPVALRGIAFQQNMMINDPKLNATWTSVEIAASKRLSNRWLFMASYSATKNNVPLLPNVGGTTFDFRLNTVDPNAEIFSDNRTWEWLMKSSGGYQFPWDLLVSANFDYRSGDVWARQVLFAGGTTIPSIVLNVEPLGTRRMPNLRVVDFRVEKTFRLSSSQRLAVRMDAFNTLNTNAVTALTQRSGASFGRPTTIVPPRNIQIGASYTF